MSAPYLDVRALLRLGIPRHTVEALQETYERTGGATSPGTTLVDLNELVGIAIDQGRLATQLRARVEELEDELEAVPSYTRQISELKQRVVDLESSIQAQPNQSSQIQSLTKRVSELESLVQALSSPSSRLNRLQSQLEELTLTVHDLPRVSLTEIIRRLDVLEAL